MASAVSFNPSAIAQASQNIFAGNPADLKKSPLPASYGESVSMSASTMVTIASKNDPMPLVYKSAINAINEALKSGSGTDALQKAAGGDNSPEGTADRIVSMATGFLGEYQKQHPNEDSTTALNNFMNEIRSGFEKGFAEAGNILILANPGQVKRKRAAMMTSRQCLPRSEPVSLKRHQTQIFCCHIH